MYRVASFEFFDINCLSPAKIYLSKILNRVDAKLRF